MTTNPESGGSAYACSLVLAAHGSLATESANQPFYEMAEQLQQSGIFSTVTPALLNGTPQINEVLATLPAGDVVVIPMMTSQGYYSKTVLPGALNENPNASEYRLMMTPAIGVHPLIAGFVGQRIATLASALRLSESSTTAVIVGHGTTRHPDSGKSTVALCENVRKELAASNSGIKVVEAFIDQSPDMDEVAASIEGNVIVIPFLISRGPHATEDVPAAFGLPTGPEIEFPLVGLRTGGMCVCDGPVGLYPEIADICLQVAADRITGLETVIED